LAALVLWLTWRNVLRGWYLLAALAVAAVMVLYAAAYLTAHDLPLPDLDARMSDDSGRVAVLIRAWEMFLEAPLLGKGIGSTVDWNVVISSHNTYLNLAADHGVLGLLMLPSLCYALVAGNRNAAPLALVLLLTGFFIHDLFSARPYLFALALFTAPEASHASALAREAASRFGGIYPRRPVPP
jgi:O-antigen ligase